MRLNPRQWTAEQLLEYRRGYVGSAKFKAEREQQRKADALKTRSEYTVGTILSGSWGYDQTNCELWQIVEREVAYAWIRPICGETVPGSEGFMSESLRPVPGKFCGEAVRKLVGPHGISFKCFTLTPCSADSKHYSSHYA